MTDPLALAQETFANPNFQKIDTCNDLHPEDLGTCEKPVPCYDFHQFVVWSVLTGNVATTWPNEVKRPKPEGGHAKAQGIADRTKAGASSTTANGKRLGDLAYAATDPEWKAEAHSIAMQILASQDLLSGNDFWRLGLSTPKDSNGIDNKRAVSGVLAGLARDGWIEITDSKVRADHGNGREIGVWKVLRKP